MDRSGGSAGSLETRPGPTPAGDVFGEYSRHVATHWGWLMLGVVATGLGFYGVVFSHVLMIRSWVWFVIALSAFSVVQFFAFRDVRRERNAALDAPMDDKVSLYAIALSRGDVPAPLAAPVDYQLHALRQVLDFLDADGHHRADVPMIDSVLKRLERDGVKLPYEPLRAHDCEEAIKRLLQSGELVRVPEDRGAVYQVVARSHRAPDAT